MNEPGMEGVGSLLAGNEKQVVCPPPSPPPALCRCPLPFVHSSHRAMKNRPAGDSCGTGPRYLPLICVQILLYSESILDSPSRHLMGCRILHAGSHPSCHPSTLYLSLHQKRICTKNKKSGEEFETYDAHTGPGPPHLLRQQRTHAHASTAGRPNMIARWL